MSKTILVLDKPKNCAECPLMAVGKSDREYCTALGDRDGEMTYWNNIPKPYVDCPLKEMPKKTDMSIFDNKPMTHVESYAQGFNECVDEILGELNG